MAFGDWLFTVEEAQRNANRDDLEWYVVQSVTRSNFYFAFSEHEFQRGDVKFVAKPQHRKMYVSPQEEEIILARRRKEDGRI